MAIYNQQKTDLENQIKDLETKSATWKSEWEKRPERLGIGINKAKGEAKTQYEEYLNQLEAAKSKLGAYGEKETEAAQVIGTKAPERVAMPTMKPFLSPEIVAMRQKFFEQQRGQAKQQGQAQLQQSTEGLARRFAAMGASGSGAQVSAMEKATEAAADTERKGLQDVAGQELQVKEGDTAREFQSAMAERGMEFQGSMADRESAFRQQLANVDQINKLKGMDMAERQFELDKMTTEFNKQMALADLQAAKDAAVARRRGGQLSAIGAIGGGLAGAYFGGPAGATAGATMGSSLGNLG